MPDDIVHLEPEDNQWPKPGRWRLWAAENATPGSEPRVLMSCPQCGKVVGLDDYSIDERGLVYPSVVCDATHCRFHGFVLLRMWPAKLTTLRLRSPRPGPRRAA